MRHTKLCRSGVQPASVLAAALLSASLVLGCAPDLDTTRVTPDRGSFGQIVAELLEERVARFAPERAAVLAAQRPLLVAAIDQAAPEATLGDLDAFLQGALPLVDDGTFAAATNAGALALASLSYDPALLTALWRLEGRDGYRAPAAAAGIVRSLLRWEGQSSLLLALGKPLAPGSAGEAALVRLGEAVAQALATPEEVADPADPERTLALVRRFLYREDDAFAAPGSAPLWGVVRDHRGLALLSEGIGFADLDRDGLPDVSARNRHVDPSGAELGLPTPFPFAWGAAGPIAPGADPTPRDANGRALANGQPLYVHRNLDRTLLAGLLREGPPLFDPDPTKEIGLLLLHGLNALLGPRTADGQAFDASRAPLLDMLHGYVQVLAAPGTRDVLEAAQVLLAREGQPGAPNAIARLARSVIAVADAGTRDTNALMRKGHTLWEEILRVDPADPESGVAARAAQRPGLIEDLLAAFEAPETDALGPQLATFLRHRDFISKDLTEDFVTPVDRRRPDEGDNTPGSDNRSLFQRMVHLIHDGNRVELCNKAGAELGLPNVFTIQVPNRCQILRVPNIATAYLSSIAGLGQLPVNYEAVRKLLPLGQIVSDDVIDSAVKALTGIDPKDPRPEQLSRLVFEPLDDTFKALLGEEILDRDGVPFRVHHPGTAYAWEKTVAGHTFYESLRPIARAFCGYHPEDPRGPGDPPCNPRRAELFGDFLALLHRHYASPASRSYQDTDPSAPDYSRKDGAVTYEEVIAFALADSGLLRAATVVALESGRLTLADGRPLRAVLAGAAKDLFAPVPFLRARPGSQLVRDQAQDGRLRSRFDLIFDAYTARFDALAERDPGDHWRTATSRLIDRVFATTLTGGEVTGEPLPALSPRWHRLLVAKVELLRERLEAHARKGDVDAWVSEQVVGNMTPALTGRVQAALVDLGLAIAADPVAKGWMYALIRHLADERQGAFVPTLAGVSDLLEILQAEPEMVPLLRALGRALGPETGFARAALTLTTRLLATPRAAFLATLLRNLVDGGAAPTELAPLGRMLEVLSAVQRTEPSRGFDLEPADFSRVMYELGTFLVDEVRGLPKFFRIVHCRRPDNCPAP